MQTNDRFRLPPLRKNYFRAGQLSIEPRKKQYFKMDQSKSKHRAEYSLRNRKDLSVSPRYLKYNYQILSQSKTVLNNEIQDIRSYDRAPINLIKFIDFELEFGSCI